MGENTKVFLVATLMIVQVSGQNIKYDSDLSKFNSKKLHCKVCEALVEEINYKISLTNPNKKTTFKKRPFLRSEEQLTEITESVCLEFEDYVQAESKEGEPAVVRLTARGNGGMNPDFRNFNVVPDDDLNTKLKYYCDSIVGEHEEHIFKIFQSNKNKSEESEKRELCWKLTGLCTSAFKSEL